MWIFSCAQSAVAKSHEIPFIFNYYSLPRELILIIRGKLADIDRPLVRCDLARLRSYLFVYRSYLILFLETSGVQLDVSRRGRGGGWGGGGGGS